MRVRQDDVPKDVVQLGDVVLRDVVLTQLYRRNVSFTGEGLQEKWRM